MAVTAGQTPEVTDIIKKACYEKKIPLLVGDSSLVKNVKRSMKKQSFSYKEYKKISLKGWKNVYPVRELRKLCCIFTTVSA